ncbi:hypothetical protein FAES_3763 [Fibrella aestuarina BUZ 2]|uniref:Lipocalin-like domain-containing protein n=1 Tax=Fibrella aestuarina BUZ 2 TaxID=1166018 RepID=I0KCB7_9BACT|nr:hypothetical protein [Fibrella aestuarina]CCH01770.1 hypothetical protein FAES_3763 [Fibrella aestuarina BUZ 2]
MRLYAYLIACSAISLSLTSCHVEPTVNPTAAYVGTYDCTLVNKTARLAEASEQVETKTYSGKMTETGERSLQLSLTTQQGSGELTFPLTLAGESVIIPQFEIATSYTTGGITTYLSNYYSGNGRLDNKTLSITLNSANYSIVGANGHQTQVSNSDVSCNCVKK